MLINLSTLLIVTVFTKVILVVVVFVVFTVVIRDVSRPSRRTLIIRSSQGENPALVSDGAHGSGKRAQTLPKSADVREIVVA